MKKILILSKGKSLGPELFNTGTIANNNGAMASFTATGLAAESDSSSINLRPRVLYDNLDIDSVYRLQISNLIRTGEINVLQIFDGNNYVVGAGAGAAGAGVLENLTIDITVNGSFIFLAFDGREIFDCSFDLSLRKVL